MKRTRSMGVAAVLCAGVCSVLLGCASNPMYDEGEAYSQPEWADREGVALSPDAEDPTARDKREGYGKWKGRDEEGAKDPMHPTRRTYGFSPP